MKKRNYVPNVVVSVGGKVVVEEKLNINVRIHKAKTAKKLKADIERFHKLRSEVLHQEYLAGNLDEIETSAVKSQDEEVAVNYLRHILKTGSSDDRREALGMIKTKFILSKKELKLK
ncbi:MAG: hypothetical protein ABFQ62_01085 [Patescibacteria group bacterium]